MPEDPRKIPAAFYRTASGAEPVRDWLRELPAEDRKVIGRDIARVEYGWPVGMPTWRPLGSGLYEVRSNLPGGRTARVLLCVAEGRLVLLHGFFKTTQQTPPSEMAIARSRQKDVQR
jgi:phage-related protein